MPSTATPPTCNARPDILLLVEKGGLVAAFERAAGSYFGCGGAVVGFEESVGQCT